MSDLVYVLPIVVLLALELEAAFGRRRHWETITEITRHFEQRSKWNRCLIAGLIILEFSHLVLNFP